MDPNSDIYKNKVCCPYGFWHWFPQHYIKFLSLWDIPIQVHIRQSACINETCHFKTT